MARHSASLIATVGLRSTAPALLTMTRTGAIVCRTTSAAPLTAEGSVTSQIIACARAPRCVTSLATARSAAESRAHSATSAPTSASRSAIARPIPRLAPVTTAVTPARTGSVMGRVSGPARSRLPLLLLFLLLLELLQVRRLVVAELLAALLHHQVERIDEAIVRKRQHRRLALELGLVLIILDVE